MSGQYINVIWPPTESFMDYPDDESNCLTIYCMGCDNNCHGCQNPEFKDQNYTTDKTRIFHITDFIQEIFIASRKAHTNKLVLCGGDFLSKCNIDFTKSLLHALNGVYDICIYTGHSIEYCHNNGIEEFTYIKCGNYIPELKQESQKTDFFFALASKNQAIYNSDFRCLTSQGILTFI